MVEQNHVQSLERMDSVYLETKAFYGLVPQCMDMVVCFNKHGDGGIFFHSGQNRIFP